MKTDLLKRVERIEKKVNPDLGITAFVIRIVDPGIVERPVKGWSYDLGAERVEVLRREGENDQELEERAVSLAHEHIPGFVCLMSIT